MKFVSWFLFAFVLTFSGGASAARAPEPIVNYTDVPITTGSGKVLTTDEVKQGIRAVAERRRWLVTEQPDGKMIASLSWNRDRHSMFVEIAYKPQSYSLTYRDSINLNYATVDGQPSIHPRYNGYVNEMKEAIRIEFMRM